MELKVFGSSSEGNCYLLTNEKESLIIEAGIHFKEVLKALDFNLMNCRGCLISHEHGDHAKYIEKVIDHSLDIYSSQGTFDALGIIHHRLKPIVKNKVYEIGNFKVIAFGVNHDCNDPLGFLINHDDLGTLLFATDTSHLVNRFPGVNHIMIECNYDEEILKKGIDVGKLDYKQAERIAKTHFGLDNVKEFLKANDLSKTYTIILMHLSERNANKSRFHHEIYQMTTIETFIAEKGLTVELKNDPF